jgi:hypothetical protein
MLHGLAVISKPPDSAYCSLVPVIYLPARLSIFRSAIPIAKVETKTI